MYALGVVRAEIELKSLDTKDTKDTKEAISTSQSRSNSLAPVPIWDYRDAQTI